MGEPESLPPYKYPPLPDNAHTRILELQPSLDSTSPLHVNLRLINLDIDPFFDALSYTWGTPVFSEEIIVENNSSLGITTNLRDALVRFRLPTKLRRLWVDAICINQNDINEKARQIPRMAEIYRGASSVLVWLGSDSDGEAHMRKIALLTQRMPGPENIEELKRAFNGLLQLPWFGRRWIIQEVSLNPNILLFCGASMIPWLRLLLIPQRIWGSDTAPKHLVQSFRSLWESHVLAGRPLRILEILAEFSEAGCADDRDRIYAIAGLAPDVAFVDDESSSDKIIININYTKSTQEIYRDFAVSVTTRFEQRRGQTGYDRFRHDLNGNDFVRHAMDRSDSSHFNGKCSWIPDWRLPIIRQSLRSGFSALRYPQSRNIETLTLEDPYCVGVVDHIFEAFPMDASPSLAISWTRKLFESVKERMLAEDPDKQLSNDDSQLVWHQLLMLLTGGQHVPSTFQQSDNIEDYIDEVLAWAKGRLVFIMSPPIAHVGRKCLVWPQLGIGPSHTRIGDIVCTLHGNSMIRRDDSKPGWFQSLIFRNTQQLKDTISPSSFLCIPQGVGSNKATNPKNEIPQNSITVDWSDFEFFLVGESLAYERRTEDRLGITLFLQVQEALARADTQRLIHVKSIRIR
ncbi:heterokaryon incompatibility protein-domain-containing protein [Hypoxylon trugodes]|uniref:heterokaryon incompatibility protein-domain-containing protein n=1 Tax=Hypoxylon trugodes TaxID=326681 RepID=UPI002190300F|nr:heterokaryon incompatibility protein-domain-containing protein [Hypoxylon trugodes]KAI1388990.1 heterokaryon incompatibility protein-domain-containing protein [Hypoxylon trugodes]